VRRRLRRCLISLGSPSYGTMLPFLHRRRNSQIGRPNPFRWLALGLLAGLLLAVAGCSWFRLPAIDPSGNRIFLPSPSYTTIDAAGTPAVSAPPRLSLYPQPAFPAAVARMPCPEPAQEAPPAYDPADLTIAQGTVGPTPITSPPVSPYPPPQPSPPLAAGPVVPTQPVVPGVLDCQPTTPSPLPTPAPLAEPRCGLFDHANRDQGVMKVTPEHYIAPVGSEVVVLAGVCSAGGRYLVGEPIQWILSQESRGHFVAVANEDDGWRGLFTSKSEKTTGAFAEAVTSGRAETLNRNTADPRDDIRVAAGQTWITVTSAVPGASRVTAVAKNIEGFANRQKTATIEWIDACWTLPEPQTGLAGQSFPLKTTVVRGDGTPLYGWTVRYTVLESGPAARLGPERATLAEVCTDACGEANVEIFSENVGPGVTHVQLEIIRPANDSLGLSRQVVGQGMTSITFSASQLALRVTGPGVAETDSMSTYRFELTNAGDLPSRDVAVTTDIPQAARYESSTPPARALGDRVIWNVGELGPRESKFFEMTLSTLQAGTLRICGQAQAAGGAAASDCATTRIVHAALDVQMEGPREAVVGEQAQYRISITNGGPVPVSGVRLTDTFDPGLTHLAATSPIVRELGELAAGETRRLAVTFTVTRSGRHCHELTVTGESVKPVRQQACVIAREPERPQPELPVQPRPTAPRDADAGSPPSEPTPRPQTPPPRPSAGITLVGPAALKSGEKGTFVITVRNTGNTTLRDLVVIGRFPRQLNIDRASGGYQPRDTAAVEANSISWALAPLPPTASIEKRIECSAVEGAGEPVSVTAAAGNEAGLREAAQWRVRVEAPPPRATPIPRTPRPTLPPRDETPPPGDRGREEPTPPAPVASLLSVTISEDKDPVFKGSGLEYLVVIHNRGDRNERQVILTLSVTPQLELREVRGPVGFQKDPETGAIGVRPISEMRAGEKIEFRVSARAIQVGKGVLTASVDSLRLQAPKTATEETTVFDQ